VLNVDGIEWQRAKWGAAARLAFRVSERLAAAVPHAVVADARVIQDYYLERYGLSTTFIPYGGDLPAPKGNDWLEKLRLVSNRYALYVSRLEPENNALAVVQAWKDVPGDLPLVVVGDAPYAREYIARVESAADSRVLFPGAIYGEGYRQLLAHCGVYIQATEVGGTHPALVEALGYGRVVCYNATPENEEVAGGAGLPFDARRPESLAVVLRGLLDEPDSGSVWKERAKQRVQERYLWNDVTDRYEGLLEGRARVP
jgi:glycosyltransferase involved in cell wall biosynthesis